MNFVEWGNKWLKDAEEEKKQKHKECDKAWKKAHPEAVRAINAKYQKAHPEVFVVTRARYREAHPERVKAAVRKYQETHHEEISKWKRAWCKEHPEIVKAWKKTWREAHLEQARESSKKSKSKRKRNLGFIPLNVPFEGSNAHHIDKDYIVYIPSELHESIHHSVLTGKNMKEINKLALDYFEKLTV